MLKNLIDNYLMRVCHKVEKHWTLDKPFGVVALDGNLVKSC